MSSLPRWKISCAKRRKTRTCCTVRPIRNRCVASTTSRPRASWTWSGKKKFEAHACPVRGCVHALAGLATQVSAAATIGAVDGAIDVGGITITLPPVQAAEQFLYREAQARHRQCALGGGVAADTVAVGNDQCIAIKMRSGFGSHGAMGNIDGAGNMFGGEGVSRPGINKDDLVALVQQGLEIPRVGFKGEL